MRKEGSKERRKGRRKDRREGRREIVTDATWSSFQADHHDYIHIFVCLNFLVLGHTWSMFKVNVLCSRITPSRT